MLVGEKLTRLYSDGTGISSINISINSGEVIVIEGPSGSGKSTLLRVLSLLDYPDEGTIELDDYQFVFPRDKKRNKSWLYPKVTVVFQQLFLWPHLTNRQNLLLPIKSSSQREVISRVVKGLEIEPFLDKYPNQVSLGQRQRVALGRALVLKPRYLLLDEVTSALDLASTNNVCRLLKEELDRGLGILAITHDREFAKLMAKSSYWLENGALLT